MSKAISLGKKKKSFNSIMEAARLVTAQTGEPVERVYIRMWKRMNSGKSVKVAMTKPPRQYVRKQIVEQQVGV